MERLHEKFTVVRNAVSEERQIELLDTVRIAGTTRTPYRYGFDKLCALRTGGDSGESFGLAEEAERIYSSIAGLGTYNAQLVECLAYQQKASLRPHVDYVNGEAIILTLGADTHFFYGIGRRGTAHKVLLHSGDAIIFPTDKQSNVMHGIERFGEFTPDWFLFDDYCRICIQWRQGYQHVPNEDDST